METTPQTEPSGPPDPTAEMALERPWGERLRNANRRAMDFIEAQPTACLIGALAAGFLLGRVMRDRR